MYWIQAFTHQPGTEGPAQITQLSVSTPTVAWAIDGDNQIWTYDFESNGITEQWTKPTQLPNSEKAIRIDSAWDGTVICIESTHKVYRYDMYNDDWILMPNGTLNEVTVGSNDMIYGLGENNLLYYYAGEGNYLGLQDGGAFKQVSVGNDDTLFAIGLDNKLYRIFDWHGSTHFQAVSSEANFNAIAVDSAAYIMALTSDNEILTYIGEGQFDTEVNVYYFLNSTSGEWETATIPGDYIAMSHDADGNCYMITHDATSGTYLVFQTVEGEHPSVQQHEEE